MSDDKRLKAATKRYLAAAHAMQSGVAAVLDKSAQEPKHLRVGINTAMVDHGALVDLLIRKGVFTREEYAESLADAMEKEALTYRRKIAGELGVALNKIHLA